MTKRLYGKPKPAYQDKVIELGQTLPAGKAHIVEVLHDDHCGIWRGKTCGCKPDVKRVVAQ